jgi:hypothetical protein
MKRRGMPTHRSGRAWLVSMGLAVGLILAAGGSGLSVANAGMATTSTKFFKVCDGTAEDGTPVPHGLCAVASCFVLNNLAYCQCDVASGDSISLPFKFDNGQQDICTVNAAGIGNGYMASTFSFPPSVVLPPNDPGAQALYTCPPIVSDGTYAQCDGGICFTSAQSFPGSGQSPGSNQIICSCPIAPPAQARLGYQIPGPFPCQKSFFQNCKSKTANTNTGSTIYSGAPIGSARFLTHQLYGTDPSINQCPSPHD